MVFFIDRVGPGMEIDYFEQVPNIGADLLFAAIVGFLNASVFPFLAILELTVSRLKLALFTGVISYGSFAVIAVIPFGVQVVNFWGFLVGGSLVWAVAYTANYLEWQRDKGLY
jgi:uncharacterized membrane protein YvlD (DUF360 family)